MAIDGFVGIAGEGSWVAMCDTCLVYAADGGPGSTPKWSENEMLEFTACERRSNGRLSTRLVASAGNGGPGVHLMDTRI
ncbi:hypothetical protein EVC45_38750 [Paraburkholderia sp. UYCP14C]|uniref:hypothetical protein n=1 Tax=Paraburkholderia sp. UYCP14C TaxID=2511130 RepID=UPI001021A78C|nr:hypothetical protein [Paraburkholderia sp. UYCP14C]RZF24452.1 hypothetical protein EVC45_38750 [Paraburkholderia sp. UYCP14C]